MCSSPISFLAALKYTTCRIKVVLVNFHVMQLYILKMFVLYRSVSEFSKLDGHLLHLSPIFAIRYEKGDLTFDRKKACYTKV